MKTCHYNTKKNRKKQKNRVVYVKMFENIEIPIRVFRHPRCFTKPAYVSGTGLDHTRTGAGFVGTGPGWTVRTRARPVCHPSDVSLNRSAYRQRQYQVSRTQLTVAS